MCFFEQTRWMCGFWRWGHFREQCNREYRTGETCGLKFVYRTNDQPEVCKLCKDIEKKRRKLAKLESDLLRWSAEKNRSASIEKAQKDWGEVNAAIKVMDDRHNERTYRTV
ncbi:hypothetical protein SAMD00023353_4000680 [Rosellinia necatrix]|uniref:LAMTOR1 MEH1 n=1 Tax=Rosellinia necatrix TaxID=77044 RepID=A0A1W2TM80_ROSNE|nr:hypothetical protein SAMD00023353_4000680 [Rosellinia necatrix]